MSDQNIRIGKMPGIISCDEATYLISKKQDEKLNFWQTIKLKIHFFFCRFCRRYDNQMEILEKIIQFARLNSNKKLSKSDKESMHKRLMAEKEK